MHGLRHVALAEVGSGRLAGELREGRELLESLTQQPLTGFRAPIFSLTPATRWAVDLILEAGFVYSSSVLPAANPLHGWPGAPRRPYRWNDALIELPCPVAGHGRISVPFLGGVYLRYLPMPLVRRFLAGLDGAACPWSYLHPYDLDSDEEFFVMAHAGWLTSRIAHSRRSETLARLDSVIDAGGGPGPTLAEVVTELLHAELPGMPTSG